MDDQPRKRGFRFVYLLLILPFAAMLWVPSYNRVEPELSGIPFFYWYQLAWIVIGALLLLPVWMGDRS